MTKLSRLLCNATWAGIFPVTALFCSSELNSKVDVSSYSSPRPGSVKRKPFLQCPELELGRTRRHLNVVHPQITFLKHNYNDCGSGNFLDWTFLCPMYLMFSRPFGLQVALRLALFLSTVGPIATAVVGVLMSFFNRGCSSQRVVSIMPDNKRQLKSTECLKFEYSCTFAACI